MPITIVASDGNGGNKTSETQTAIVLSPATALAVDDIVVIMLAADNAGAAGIASTTGSMGALSSGAITWETPRVFNRTAANVALDGITLAILVGRVTTAVNAGATQTVNWSPATIAKAWRVLALRGAAATALSFVSTGGNGGSVALNVNNAPRYPGAGDLIIGVVAVESAIAITTGDTDTLNGTWAAFVNGTSGGSGSDNTKVAVGYQTKLVTGAAASQQFNASITTSDYGVGFLVIGESANKVGSAIVTGSGVATIVRSSARAIASVRATGAGVVTRTAVKGALYVPPAAGAVGVNQYRSTILATPGLVLYWRLADAVPEVGPALQLNGGIVTGVPGAIGDGDTAMTFDGADDHISPMTSPANLNLGDVFTLESWINLNGLTASTGGIISKGGGACFYRIHSDGTVGLLASQVAAIVTSTVPVPNIGWHHVVATKDGAAVHLYIDGIDRTGTVNNATVGNSPDAVCVGAERWGGGITAPFKGSIDEPAMYSRALSAGEVQAHFSAAAPRYRDVVLAEPALVSYWRLGEASGLATVDSKGTNNGSFGGNPTLGAGGGVGDGNTAVAFNGTSQFVTVPNSATLQFGNYPWSIEFWIRRSRWTYGDEVPISKVNQFDIVFAGDDSLYLGNQSSAGAYATKKIRDSLWHHVVLTRASSADGATRWYIDGVDDTATSVGSSYAANAHPLVFGARSPGYNIPFGGSLDEIAIYNAVLTPAQVMTHYTAGPRFVPGSRMFSDTPPSNEAYDATTVGNRFTVNAAGEITAIAYWHHGGENSTHFLRIYDGTGTRVVTYDDVCGGAPAGWRVLQLPTPLVVTAGTYTVCHYGAGWYYGYHAPEASLVAGLTSAGSFNAYGADAYPTTGSGAATYTVDVVYHSTVTVSSAIATGGGVVTYAASKAEAHFGSAILTGSGVVTPAVAAGRSTSRILTASGVVTVARTAGRTGSRIVTASGVVTRAGTTARFVALSGVGGAPESMHAADAPPSSFAGDYTTGMSLTPTVDGTITHIRYWHHAGGHAPETHQLSIWTMAGAKLATVAHPEGAAGWLTAALPTPLVVSAGVSYVVSLAAHSYGYYSTGYPASLAPHLTAGNDGRYLLGADVFPTTLQAANHYPIDVVFLPGVAGGIVGAGVVTIVYRLIEAKTGSAIVTGSGVVTATRASNRAGSGILTGSGVVTRTSVAGRSRSAILTASGVVTRASVAGRRATGILTGSGVVVPAVRKASTRTAIVTGGGVVRYAFSILEARSGFTILTGSGVVARSVRSSRRTRSFTIVSASIPRSSLTVAGDASFLQRDDTITVGGSAGNNGTYTIIVADYLSGTTELSISETITSAAGGGTVYPPGAAFARGSGTVRYTALAQQAGGTALPVLPVGLGLVVPAATGASETALPVLGITTTIVPAVATGAAAVALDPIVLSLGLAPAVATGASETPTGTVGVSVSIVVPLSSAPGDATLPVLALTTAIVDVVTAGAAATVPAPIVLGLTVPGAAATVPIDIVPDPIVLGLAIPGATAGGGAVPFFAGVRAIIALNDLRAYVEADDMRAIVTGDTAHATILT